MLDTLTLMIVLLLSTLVMAVVMTLVSLNQRQYPGPRCWAVGSWLVFVGCGLLILRDNIPIFLSSVMGNLGTLGATALIAHGLYRFLGLTPPARFHLGLCAVSGVCFVLFLHVWDNITVRVVIYSLCMALLTLDGCRVLLKNLPSIGGWAYRFTAAVLGVVGCYQIARAVLTPWLGHPATYFGPNLVNAINLLVLICAYLSLAVGLVMMLSARLSADLNAHMADLRDEIAIRREAEKRLALEATLDPLTGAANRRKLFEDAVRAQAFARRHGRPLAAIMLDLDNFKLVNDSHGHEVGDAILRALTAHCRGQLRREDTFARYGGEEFVILLPESDAAQAAALAERLRSGMHAIRLPSATGVARCTCSFGVAQLTPEDENMEAVLRRADQALYLAKAQGRDRVVIWRREDFSPPVMVGAGA